jgi:hypothetical protein
VTAPDGAQWTIRRVWAGRAWPRWRRVRVGDGMAEAGWWSPAPDNPEDIGIWLVAVLAGVVLVLVLIPLLLFGFELVLLGVLIAGGILARTLLGRPWIVRAESGDGGRALEWQVRGWRRSARALGEVRDALAAGLHPEPADAEPSGAAALGGRAS